MGFRCLLLTEVDFDVHEHSEITVRHLVKLVLEVLIYKRGKYLLLYV